MTACTDDERRRVAERLRRLNAPSLIAMMSILDVGGRDLCSRLADLIEPSDLLTEISCLRSCLADTEENARLIEGARKKEHRELLELANLIDLQADDNIYDDQMADGHWVAQAIREAIGA